MESTDLYLTEDRYLVPSYKKSPLALERGSGAVVWDDRGRSYLDLYGGHAVCILGHCHPRLVSTLERESQRLMFYSSVNYSKNRALSAKALVEYSQSDFQVFFSNSGAEANENALKMARILTGKPGVISFEGSFHGRTKGALGVTGIPKYRTDDDPNVRFATFGDLASVEKSWHDGVGAVIVEAIQSLSGVRVADRSFFEGLSALCKEKGAFLILDEIQTGLGRTGTPFYFHSLGIEPDVVTLAKGLAGGIPAAATLIQRRWSKNVHAGDLGSTFGGGPLVCELIRVVIETLKSEHCAENSRKLGTLFRRALSEFSSVKEVRGEGLLLGVETDRPAATLEEQFRSAGILLGTSLHANTIRLLPPLTLHERHVEEFVVKAKGIL